MGNALCSEREPSVSTARTGRPTVDVVVPAYNEELYIKACMDAVLSQDYPAPLRLVLIHAGSSDSPLAIAEARAADDERVVVVSGRGRLSAPEALNVGIEVSDAEVFAR